MVGHYWLRDAALAPNPYGSTANFLPTGTLTAVPEPSSYAVCIAGLLGAIILLRRRSPLRK